MITTIMVLALVSCHALCIARVFVELLAVRWGVAMSSGDGKPLKVKDSFSIFLEALLFALRCVSAPLFFIFDLFSVKGWMALDKILVPATIRKALDRHRKAEQETKA